MAATFIMIRCTSRPLIGECSLKLSEVLYNTTNFCSGKNEINWFLLIRRYYAHFSSKTMFWKSYLLTKSFWVKGCIKALELLYLTPTLIVVILNGSKRSLFHTRKISSFSIGNTNATMTKIFFIKLQEFFEFHENLQENINLYIYQGSTYYCIMLIFLTCSPMT